MMLHSCRCGARSDVRVLLVLDMSDKNRWRRVGLAICVECAKRYGLYCAQHDALMVGATHLLAETYLAHPEALYRACHRCALVDLHNVSAVEKQRVMAFIETRSDRSLMAACIPDEDAGLLDPLNAEDVTMFSLLFAARLEGREFWKIVTRLVGIKQAMQPSLVN